MAIKTMTAGMAETLEGMLYAAMRFGHFSRAEILEHAMVEAGWTIEEIKTIEQRAADDAKGAEAEWNGEK